MSVIDTPAPATPTTPTLPAEEPKPYRDRAEAIIDQFTASEAEAAESAAEIETPADETPEKPADQDGGEPKPAETPNEETERLEVTAEQLDDKSYWGGLDEKGWARMQRDYPVQTALVKASQAAGSRIVNEARKEAERILSEVRTTAPATRSDASPDDGPSPELLAAIEQSQSFDLKEAAKGFLKIQQLTAPKVLKDQGFDPARAKSDATAATAYQDALKQAPELAQADHKALEAIIDASPALSALANTGTAENLTIVMVTAWKEWAARKEAETAAATSAADKARLEAEKKKRQETVRSNARPASAAVIQSQSGAPAVKATLREKLSDKFDRVAAQFGQQ